MWLFTKYGFFSVVSARLGDGAYGNGVDVDRVMVRARDRRHLERLQERFCKELETTEIRESPSTDYRFRIFVSKSAWKVIAEQLADEINYDNFKSEVHRHTGHNDASYTAALHEVWSVMHRLQSQ